MLWGGGEGARSEADPYRIAQIRPDASLSTQVNGVCDGSGGSCNITNGATRGSNLFHSFLQFSLPNGDIADFQTTPAIQNVIVRVTGIGQAFVSNINGTIQTSNPANFFLLNPNGIIFSAGATLNIGGSFVATTAEKMVFQDGTMFGVHAPTPLLTVSVPIGLQLGQSPGAIQMQSSYLSSADTSNFGDFALVGGKVSLEGATLIDPGHRIELGGLAEPGVVGLNINGNSLSLSFPEGVERADVSLSPDTTNNSSSIDVTAGGGGSVAVHARNLTVSGGSSLVAGIGSGLGTPDSQAGDITLDATGIIDINQSSYIENDVYRNAIGNSGNIHVKTGSLSITSGADLGTFVLGQGKVGDVVIDAKDSITLEGTSPDGKSSSGLFSLVSQSATGQGGNISIMTGFLSLANSAVILDSTFGKGNAGSINIQAANDITLNNDAFIVSLVQSENAIGNGGNVTIGASSIFVQGGSQINALALLGFV